MKRRASFVLGLILLAPVAMWAQTAGPICNITAVNPVVRAEGVAERLGDIVISCTGVPGTEIVGNLTATINTLVTNREIDSSGGLDVALTTNGAVANTRGTRAANNQISWSGLRFAIPTQGPAEIRISNIRADASFGGAPAPPQTGPAVPLPQPILAQLSWNAANSASLLNFTQTNFQVGVPERGLYATAIPPMVPSHPASPVPEELTMQQMLTTGTMFGTTRVTEGQLTSFEPRASQETQGTRIMLRFSGYPENVRLFVPVAVAGSSAQTPTRAGDLGGTPSAGVYVAGSNTLLLVRVRFTDPTGAGGVMLGAGGELGAMAEVDMRGGAGIAVYEVADASPLLREWAQIPVFLGVPRSQSARIVTPQVRVTFAPLSSTATTSSVAPVPRFLDVVAGADCSLYRDCDAHTPRLSVAPASLDFRLTRGVGVAQRNVSIANEGGGQMPWTASVEYARGSGWLRLTPEFDRFPGIMHVFASALANMEPGIYEATIVISAGNAGQVRRPVRLEVVLGDTSPPPPVTPTRPAITGLVHGATFQAGTVARGSLVTLRGSNLTGNNIQVTFDGTPARLLYTSSDQINLQVPENLAGNTAQVVVSVSGVASDAFTVNVAAANPGVFNPGIVNQDGSVNSAANPANTGTHVQIFATGLLAPDGAGVVEARVHDTLYTNLPYAGPAPGIPGLQQVNLFIEEGWPNISTDLVLCTTAGGSRQCSPPVRIHIRQAQ